MNTVISLEHVNKVFGDFTALDDVNCSVSQGEIFGLLGPSGAGKTTIIKILTGQLFPTKGHASIFGVDSKKLTDDVYSKIGMVLDNSGLYSRLNCYDNLKLFIDIYGLNDSKIKSAMEAVKLSDAIKRPVNKLSKGMTQRLVFARAILHEPKLLFLDEPTSGLDPATSLEIHKLILNLRENGATIFMTTHNMAEATQLCDHVALLNAGQIVEYGEPEAVCRKHNQKSTISILLASGEQMQLPNDHSSGEKIAALFQKERITSIHSSEPNLETVFIALTGRKLV